MNLEHILFLHDTSLSTPRGAELTINELIELGKVKGYKVSLDYLEDFETVKTKLKKASFVVLNSTSRCSFELELIAYILSLKIYYIKVEYDYNFCIRRNILCTVDPNVKSCCHSGKFHLFRKLFANAELNVFQSPKHYQSHFDFYGEAISKHIIMPPTVQVDKLKLSKQKDSDTIPFFGDLNYLKGGHDYVNYAEEHPELKFSVYGNNRLQRQMPENITFLRPIPNEDVLEILGKTEKLICKPVWPEPSGRLAAEAFLSGCEILGNDRIGTFSFDFYPNDKERAIAEIRKAPDALWNEIAQILEANSKEEKTPKLKKVLVYKSYGGLGDIFFAIPAIYKLAEVSEVLHLAVAPRLVNFFKKHLTGVEIVDETIAREEENNYTNIYELGNYPAFRGYDLPHALKYPTHKKIKQHAIQHYIDTIAKLHLEIDNHLESYPYFERVVDIENPYFVVHHGAGFLLKIWPTEKYAALIELLHEIYPNLRCKIIMGPDDPDIEKFFTKVMPHVDFVTGGMEDVGHAMSGALFHIGNDAGITHVAGSFNVPTVGIYGPTGPGSWGSFAKHNELIWGKKGVCDIRCNYDVILNCEHRICLNSVTVNRVIEALYKVLQRAYADIPFKLKVNPEASFETRKKDSLVIMKEKELLLEFHTDEMKDDLQNVFTDKKMVHPISNDLQQVIDVLVEQQILLKIPIF